MYHLDKPIPVQFFYWLRNLMHFDLGYSFAYMSPVTTVIGSRIGNTFLLSLVSIVMAWSFAIPLGILSAIQQNRVMDRTVQFIAFIGMAIPNFFLCLLLLYAVSVTGWLPLGGMRSVGYQSLSAWGQFCDVARHLVIPAVVISTASMASLQRIMRATLLDVLRAPYVVTARAKGLPEHQVITRHAVRNSINPLVTISGFEFSALLSGAALTEIICSWPGLGTLMLSAVQSRDVYLVMGSMLMGGVMLLAGNLLADCMLAWVDPRIKLK